MFRDQTMWKNTDPRLDINKRAAIVILRPSPIGHGRMVAGTGFVDTKEGWHISTDFEDYLHLGADADWDPIWQWAFAPTV